MEWNNAHDHPERVVRLLGDLVSISSANVDRTDSDTRNAEGDMVRFLNERLSDIGFEVERRHVRAGRENIFARLNGVDRSRTLVLEAHMDTVGTEGMTIEPHNARIVEGRVIGRGACDAKGAMAAFIEAMNRVAESGQPPPWDVLFIGAMGEETGCEGATALTLEGFAADAAIVGEPTSCRPLVTHKGAVWWKLSTEGVTAHGSTPHMGVNAIYRMRQVLQVLEEEIPERLAVNRDTLLGSPTISCGMISAGEKPNVVPARASVCLDSRILPESDPYEHVEQVTSWIQERVGQISGPLHVDDVEVFHGFRIKPDHWLATRCLSACRDVLGNGIEPVGGSFFSDAGPLSHAETPCVVLGPGTVQKAHSPDEFVEIVELIQCVEIVQTIIREIPI